MKVTVYICFFVLWLFSFVIIVEGGLQNVKAKSGAELRGIKQYCSRDEECESNQCCPIPGRENHKKCYGSCVGLRQLNQVKARQCTTKTFRNKNITYCSAPTITFFQALRDCCREGGQLPLVNDFDTLKFLAQMVKDNPIPNPAPNKNEYGWMWTGLTKIKTNPTATERWTWYQPNSPKWNASFWDKLAPNDNINETHRGTSQTCSTIGWYYHGAGNHYGVTDDACSDKWGYVCVTPLKSP